MIAIQPALCVAAKIRTESTVRFLTRETVGFGIAPLAMQS